MSWLYDYSLFLVETVTIVFAIILILGFIFILRKKGGFGERITINVDDLSERYKNLKESLHLELMNKHDLKVWKKEQKRIKKQKNKENKHSKESLPRLFVLSFKGDIQAQEVELLRREVTSVLSVAQENDEVLLKLESPGGVVHGYGLAASQLQRVRDNNIKLTVVVDKVAASGGYMMACVANKIVAAPFAILGSIGVVAQIPNIHRLLKKNDIDIEQHTAGQYKRTLTMLGENTQEGRDKFKQELDETHHLFKDFVSQHRESLNIDEVATGEHWFGLQAKEKGLVDEISTSDDWIISHIESFKVVEVRAIKPKKMTERITSQMFKSAEKVLSRFIQNNYRPLL